MSYKGYKTGAKAMIESLKERGVDIYLITRSQVYDYNKGYVLHGFERYFKRWEDLYEAVAHLSWGFNFGLEAAKKED